jgi:Cu/Ag efflux protein CusF
MKTLTLMIGLAIAASSGIAQAASHEHNMSQHQMASPATAAIHKGAGVLKAINAKDHKVQITHEAIADLGWPPMTMWFALRDPLPQDLQIGAAVRFEMTQNDKKQWVIIKIGRK